MGTRITVLFAWYDLYRVGGVETDMWLLGRHLPGFGVEPCFLQMADDGPLTERFTSLRSSILTAPLDTLGTAHRTYRFWARSASRLRADIVVINDRFGWEMLPHLAPEIKVAVIYHIFDKGSQARPLAIRHASRIDAHIANSEVTSAQLAEGLPNYTDRIHTIHCGIDVPPWSECAKPDLAERVNVVYVGRLVKHQKRIMNLLPFAEALRQRMGKRVHLYVVGDGADRHEVESSLRHLAGDVVTVTGPLEPDRVQKIQASAHFWISFSDHEGIPMSLREALAAGSVPVTTKADGVPDGFLTEGKTARHFGIDDADGAAAIINELADKPEEWKAMSSYARELGEQRDGVAMARDYASVFRRICESQGGKTTAADPVIPSPSPELSALVRKVQVSTDHHRQKTSATWALQTQALEQMANRRRAAAISAFTKSLTTGSDATFTRRSTGCLKQILSGFLK